MGIMCKPVGKMKSIMRKIENQQMKEKQIKRTKEEDKKDAFDLQSSD